MMKALYITPGDTPDKAFGSSPVTDAVRENAITIHIPFLSLFFCVEWLQIGFIFSSVTGLERQ